MIQGMLADFMEVYKATIYLSIGLVILMSVNIILGTVNSLFESEFDISIFLKGVGRAFVLIVCFCAVFIAGVMNRTTLVIGLGDAVEPIDIVSGIHALLLAGYYTYSKQVLMKMGKIVNPGGDTPVNPGGDTPVNTNDEPH